MALRARLTILLSVALLISNVNSGRESSKLKELDITKQLENDPNQSIMKTIETEYGDIYDCVDFYKQPAFNYPALKNHNFHPEMRPSSRPKHSAHDHQMDAKHIEFGLKGRSCPIGTVPIRRATDQQSDTNRVEALKKFNHSSWTKGQPNVLKPGYYNAVAQSKSPQVYYGVGANLTVHNVPVSGYESSSGLISITSYPDTIQVGWTVNPILYKNDFKTRMFIFTDLGGRSCHNTDCPGFVLVRADIPLDSVLAPYTEPRGPLSIVRFFIYQDEANGNWWLEVGKDYTTIGFWPQQIFSATGLAGSGSYVACGGEVYHPVDIPGVADMGSGFHPSKHVKFNSYCYNFIVLDKDHKTILPQDTEPSTNRPTIYSVEDKFILHPVQLDNNTSHVANGSNIVLEFEHIVVYGGPQNYS